MRRFWIVWGAVALLWTAYLVTMTLGPAVETWAAPIRVEQRIERVVRDEDQVCWNWRSTKVRELVSDDLDAHILFHGSRYVTGVYRADTGQPWGATGAVGLGPRTLRYCTPLPPRVLPVDPVRIEWAALYPVFFGTGLYRLPLRLPAVEVAPVP